MRRLVRIVPVLWVASLASAGWFQVSVPGLPYDLQVHDAGHLSVSTSNVGVQLFVSPDGGVVDGGAVGALGQLVGTVSHVPSGCFGVLRRSGGEVHWASGSCGASYGVLGPGDFATRFRQSPGGPGYATGNSGGLYYWKYSASGGFSNDWVDLVDATAGGELPTLADTTTYRAISVARSGAADYALLATLRGDFPLLLARDGQAIAVVPRGTTPTAGLHLFSRSTGGVGAFVAPTTGPAEHAPNLLDGGFQAVSMLPAPDNVYGIAFVETPQATFGWMGGRVAAGPVLYSAVPSSAEPGRHWQLGSPQPPLGVADVRLIACTGPDFCAASVNDTGPGNVLVYWNQSPPVVPAAVFQVDEGASAQVALDAGDPDGDAVKLDWLIADGGVYPLQLTPLSADGKRVQFDAPLTCAPLSFDYVVRGTDGHPGHLTTQSVRVDVARVLPPQPPQVSPSNVSVEAGEAPVRFAVSAAASGCPPTSFSWSEQSASGYSLEVDGGEAWFIPPEVHCSLDAGQAVYSVRAADGVDASVPTAVSVQVLPWGTALAPSFPADAGQVVGRPDRVPYQSSSVGHLCHAAPGFPGVETLWSWQPGSAPPGVRLYANGQDVTSQSAFTADGVEVEAAQDCVEGELVLDARHSVVGGGKPSPSASLHIALSTELQPLTPATPFVLTAEYDVSRSAVDVSANAQLNCLDRRQVRAVVEVARLDGGVEAQAVLPVPGQQLVPLPAACAGGDFQLGATLEEGGASGTHETRVFSTPRQPVMVPSLTQATLGVTCGEGGSGTLTLAAPDPGFCAAPRFTWSALEGPSLVPFAAEGREVVLQTESVQAGELIGRSLRFRVLAEGGPQNEANRELEAQLVPSRPFVGVERGADRLPAGDSEAVGVTLALRNESECPLEDATLEEQLDGLRYVAGSARVEGQQPALVEQGEGRLRVRGLWLPARETVVVRYLARPPWLGAPSPQAEVQLRGVVVSHDVHGFAQTAGTGCGCGSGAGAWSLLAWVTLWRLRSRRRR